VAVLACQVVEVVGGSRRFESLSRRRANLLVRPFGDMYFEYS
jgi:hypothetical protein